MEKIVVKAPVYKEFKEETEEIVNQLSVYGLNLLAQHEDDPESVQNDIQYIYDKIGDVITTLDEYLDRYYD